MGRPRTWLWLLLIGWLPMWALYGTLILSNHPGSGVSGASHAALRAVLIAAVLAFGVQYLTRRVPWPRPMRISFALLHGVAAVLFSVIWVGLIVLLEQVISDHPVLVIQSLPGAKVILAHGTVVSPSFQVIGIWLYVMVAGVSYATAATERAARAEALAARAQLAALRGQLNPHFLFNALHTVVQLIPREPKRAAQAAEQVAGLLRTLVEEDRDLVSLDQEARFVERYLEIERIRFGDRLLVSIDLPEEVRDASVPSFALQTLVENAVRHGAAPRVDPTTIEIAGRRQGDTMTLTVRDTGDGATDSQLAGGGGTGLARLRDRLAALYGRRAALDIRSEPNQGLVATLTLPVDRTSAG